MRWSVVAGYNVCNTLENKNSSRGFMFFVKSVIRNNTRVPLKCSRKKLNLNLQHFRNILLQALETSHRVFSTLEVHRWLGQNILMGLARTS